MGIRRLGLTDRLPACTREIPLSVKTASAASVNRAMTRSRMNLAVPCRRLSRISTRRAALLATMIFSVKKIVAMNMKRVISSHHGMLYLKI